VTPNKEIASLEALVRFHKRKYYQGEPAISDDAYDELERALKAAAPDSEALTETGSPEDTYNKEVTHKTRMCSLEFVRDVDDFMRWYDKHAQGLDLTMTPKIDGLALSMQCSGGVCHTGATRGDGKSGLNVTDNLMASVAIPTENLPLDLEELRGEVYMPRKVLTALNAKLPEDSKLENCRNAAAGGLRSKDPAKCKARHLGVFLYDIPNKPFSYELQKSEYAKKHKLPFVPTCLFPGVTSIGRKKFLQILKSTVAHWADVLRDQLPYDIDGLVFAINDMVIQQSVGYGGNGKFPNGKKAFKFASETVRVKVSQVVWQAGRTGHITPVAEFPSTYIMGSNVARATLHNRAKVLQLGIVPGSEILVEKRGDIIPGMVEDTEVLSGAGIPDIPEYCPSCGGSVVDKDVYLTCVNPACDCKVTLRLKQFCKIMGIKGFGGATLDKLYDHGIDSIDKFLGLRANAMEEAGLTPGLSKKLAGVLMAVQEATLDRFLASLGIPGMDLGIAGKLRIRYPELGELLRRTAEDVADEVSGIGLPTARKIFQGLHTNQVLIREMLKYISIVQPIVVDGPLKGKTICITGSLSRSKREWKDLIEGSGGSFTNNLGRLCNYLVTADLHSPSGKMERASKLGINIITEKDLEMLVNAKES